MNDMFIKPFNGTVIDTENSFVGKGFEDGNSYFFEILIERRHGFIEEEKATWIDLIQSNDESERNSITFAATHLIDGIIIATFIVGNFDVDGIFRLAFFGFQFFV